MKNSVFAALTFMVLAGSTATVSAMHTAAPKTSVKSATIPPPSCPVGDPRGCGIYG
jgi:hypothetical protein